MWQILEKMTFTLVLKEWCGRDSEAEVNAVKRWGWIVACPFLLKPWMFQALMIILSHWCVVLFITSICCSLTLNKKLPFFYKGYSFGVGDRQTLGALPFHGLKKEAKQSGHQWTERAWKGTASTTQLINVMRCYVCFLHVFARTKELLIKLLILIQPLMLQVGWWGHLKTKTSEFKPPGNQRTFAWSKHPVKCTSLLVTAVYCGSFSFILSFLCSAFVLYLLLHPLLFSYCRSIFSNSVADIQVQLFSSNSWKHLKSFGQ